MRVNRLCSLSVNVLILSAVAAGSAVAASSPTGVWIDHTGRGAVEIKDCGSGKLCGHVVWLKEENDAKGCGLQILGNVKSIGQGQWDNGWIYSPEKKQKFSVELTPLDDNRLRVKGYKGIKLLSKTMIWHRASDGLKRCDQTTTARKAPPATEQQGDKAKVETPAKSARAVEPKIINPSAGEKPATKEREDRTAKVAPAPAPRDSQDADRQAERDSGDDRPSIYANPRHEDRNDRADRDQREPRDSKEIDGLASLLEKFTSEDGIEVGDGYGMKVEKGPDGEKNCRLDVPFVTVKFPCED